MPKAVRLSRKYQVVIPKEARKALGLAPGDELLVETSQDHVVLVRKPANYSRALRGLHKELWANVDVEQYLREERASWDRRNQAD